MESYSMYCELCSSIAKNFYYELQVSVDELKRLNDDGNTWQFDLHTDEENELYNYYTSIIRRNIISVVVFESLAIESYINLYGYYHLKDKFNKSYERKPTLEKLCQLCEEVTSKKFPKEEKLYIVLKELIDKRNRLVHYKAHSINIEDSSQEEFLDFISMHVGSNYNELKRYIVLYDELRQKLKSLEGCQHDIVEKQRHDLEKSLFNDIREMFTFRD